MKYKYFQRDNYVFKYGDVGDLFYIIFSGSVEVLIPLAPVSEEDDPKTTEYADVTEGDKLVKK